MISLDTHIKVTKALADGKEIEPIVKELSAVGQLKFFKSLKEVYPIEDTIRPSESFYDEFKVYDNVMDLHFGQFIMLEQYITSTKNKSINQTRTMKLQNFYSDLPTTRNSTTRTLKMKRQMPKRYWNPMLKKYTDASTSIWQTESVYYSNNFQSILQPQ